MTKYLEAMAISVLAIFAPIQAAIITVLVLVFADLATGIWAAIKRNEPITSSGIRRTISKVFIFECALLLGFLAETYLIGHSLPAAKIIGGLIGASELKSIAENSDTILGESVFKTLIDKLGSANSKK